MKSKKYLASILALTVSIFLFASCSKQTSSKKVVTVSEVTHSVFYAPQYVAINKGFFAEKGIEIELSNGQGADKVMAAVLSNNIDIGFAGPEASIYVYNEGKEDFAQVFAQVTRKDGSFLVGREPKETFHWAEELQGKTLLPGRKGGVPYMTLEYILKEKGLTPNQDVILDDSIQFALMAGAFTSGTADYVTLFEPTASLIEQEGKGYIVAAIGQETEEIPYTAYFAKKSFLEKNTELVQNFVDALYQGQQWVAQHTPSEIAEAIAPSFPDTEIALLTTVVQRYQEIGVWSETPILSEAGFSLLQTVMTEAGELEEKAPYDQLINNTFAEKSIQKQS